MQDETDTFADLRHGDGHPRGPGLHRGARQGEGVSLLVEILKLIFGLFLQPVEETVSEASDPEGPKAEDLARPARVDDLLGPPGVSTVS